MSATIRTPLSVLGTAEGKSLRRVRMYELTKNGGHMLFLPPALTKRLVGRLFERAKERGERLAVVLSHPAQYRERKVSRLIEENAYIIAQLSQYYFGTIPFLASEKVNDSQRITFTLWNGDEVSADVVRESILNSTAYFACFIAGNPSFSFSEEELRQSRGAALFHLVNTVLAPKHVEPLLFAEEEAFLKLLCVNASFFERVQQFLPNTINVGKIELFQDRSELSHRLLELLHRTDAELSAFDGVRALTLKILSESKLHAGGFLVRFFTSSMRKRKVKDLVRDVWRESTGVGAYRFQLPLLMNVDGRYFNVHYRIIPSDGVRAFLVLKGVECCSPENMAEVLKSNNRQRLKEMFNTGRAGDIILVERSPLGVKADMITREGEVKEVPVEKVQMVDCEAGMEHIPFAEAVDLALARAKQLMRTILERCSTLMGVRLEVLDDETVFY